MRGRPRKKPVAGPADAGWESFAVTLRPADAAMLRGVADAEGQTYTATVRRLLLPALRRAFASMERPSLPTKGAP